MVNFNINKLLYFLLYLFFLLFPFYSVIRVKNIPLALLIMGSLYFLLFSKLAITKKIRIPITFFPSILFIFVFIGFGYLVYGRINLRILLILLWVGVPFLLLNVIKEEIVLTKIVKILFYSTSFLSFLIIMQFFRFFYFDFIKFHIHKNGLIRLKGIGPSPNSNSFAVFVFIVFVLSFQFYKKKSIKNNLVYFTLDILLLFVLVLCESRSLLFGGIISVFFIIFWKRKIKKELVLNILKSSGVFIIFFLLFLALIPNKLVVKRIMSVELNYRTIRWSAAFDTWMKAPLTGVGFDNLKIVTSEEYNIPRKNIHNVYLEILAATGLLGFFSFGIFLLSIYILIYNLSMISEYYFYFIAVSTFFIFNITHSMLFVSIFWFLIGFMEVYYFLKREAIKAKSELNKV